MLTPTKLANYALLHVQFAPTTQLAPNASLTTSTFSPMPNV